MMRHAEAAIDRAVGAAEEPGDQHGVGDGLGVA
jgi:hypothetical protein